MSDSSRYGSRPPKSPSTDDEDYWIDAAIDVLLDVLDHEYAITSSELEARASDQTWKPEICPYPINPHWFTNARAHLLETGTIESQAAPSTSHPEPITTWSRAPIHGLKRKITDAAARKRLLTVRHNGWASRGGGNLGLIGAAGEQALHNALTSPQSKLTSPTGSTRNVLGVDPGEIDNSAFYIDTEESARPKLVQVMFEVKNTRQWYYENSAADSNSGVGRFLSKAALVQARCPDQLILPVFVARKIHPTLWRLGEDHGFLPSWVDHQLVLSDYELTEELFQEVRRDLGYGDMALGNTPVKRHLGLVSKSIPKRAVAYAEQWKRHHHQYLPPLDTHNWF